MANVETHANELVNELRNCKQVLKQNLDYYESKHRLQAIGVATPPEMRALYAQVGWPRTYVDSLEERLDVEGFRMADSPDGDKRLWDWWQANNLDIESSLGHTEALIHGTAYITVAAPDKKNPFLDPTVPVIRVESPATMYADVDPLTGRVTRALRLYTDPKDQDTDYATLYLENSTHFLSRAANATGGWQERGTVNHRLGFVPVVRMLNRASLAHQHGGSEITPELRSVTDAASRILMNMQATSELMAVPQRLLFGVAQEALASNPDNPGAVMEAYLARIIAVEDPEAHAFQWSAAELINFVNALQELAKQAASYTGLPPQYLSFSGENPASAEAIRSAESRLVKKSERKTRIFGGAWEEAMRLAMKLMDGSVPTKAYRLETIWADPATPTYSAKADAVSKLYNSGSGLIPLERARIDMGYSPEEREEMRKWDKESPTNQLTALAGLSRSGIPYPQPGDDEEDEAS